jgi:hypothetical protein
VTFEARDLVRQAPPGDLIIRACIRFHERSQPPPQDDGAGGARLQVIKDLACA